MITKKEFILDIDLNDYDNVRTCCKDASVCQKCWVFISAAVTVSEYLLSNYFDYHKILWVFSGRRGIHGWVCDEEATKLSKEERSSLISFLSFLVIEGSVMPKVYRKKASVNPNHLTAIKVAAILIEKGFLFDVFLNQHLLTTKKGIGYLSSVVPSNLLQTISQKSELDEGQKIKYLFTVLSEPSYHDVMIRMVLELLYPRFDIAVSEQPNHLVKSPFSIHPDTGMISSPIASEKIRDFNIEKDTLHVTRMLKPSTDEEMSRNKELFGEAIKLLSSFY